MSMDALGYRWPDTGRSYPEGAKLEIHRVHDKWADLVWHDPKRDSWVYVSTLPVNQIKSEDLKEYRTI